MNLINLMYLTPMLMSVIIATSPRAQGSEVNSWKTLINNNGFEFKYPNCWSVEPWADDMDKPVTESQTVDALESESCSKRPLLNPPQPNGMSFHSSPHEKTPEEVLDRVHRSEKSAKNAILRRDWLYFKSFKNQSHEAYVYVGLHKEVGYTWIRWEMELYCPTRIIYSSGPEIKNPDQTLLDKLKAGDIGMPEPEKRIFDSIRCVEPKSSTSVPASK